MANINFILQGKGGVGQSLVASLLAQYYQYNDIDTLCLDADQLNRTFASYKALNVTSVDIFDGGKVDIKGFDSFVEKLIKAPGNAAVVIDSGASTFLPLCVYIKQNNILSLLADQGHEVKLHTVVTGGQALLDTMNYLESLLVNFANVPVVIWLNCYFGKPEMNGVAVEESKLFQNTSHNVHAFIRLDELRKETFGFDFNRMLQARLTFKETLASTDFMVMQCQRLTMIRRAINQQISQANL